MAAELPYVRVYAGFTTPTVGDYFTIGHPTLGQVGVVPIGPDGLWTEITPWVRSWSVRLGSSKGDDPTLRYDAGSATIVLNDGDRRFDPDNLDGPYVVSGETLLKPMCRIKMVATWAGIDYPLYYGFADRWKSDYDGNDWTTCTLTATDAFKVFAAKDRQASTPVGAGQDSGARIGAILDAYGWPAADRVISTGDTVLQATDMSGNMHAELLLVQDSEGGELYMDRQGRVVFRNRKAMLTATRSKTVQALFGDDPAGYAISGELPYADVEPVTPDETMVNSVDVSCAGGTEQHVEDAVSVGRYLPKSHTRNDLLMTTDAEALNWGQSILYQYSRPPRRFSRISFRRPKPAVEDVLWPVLLGSQFADRITVRTRPAGGGSAIEKDCFVRGIEMSQSDAANWDTAFVLQGAERYSFFTIGHPTLGRIGYNAVAY